MNRKVKKAFRLFETGMGNPKKLSRRSGAGYQLIPVGIHGDACASKYYSVPPK